MYGSRANKQFDIAFCVFWTLPGPIGHSDILFLGPDKTVLTIFMFESQLIQMPGPRDIVIYWPGHWAFPVVQKPRGWAHMSVEKLQGARGGMVTGQIDTCITAFILSQTRPDQKTVGAL